MTGSFLWSRGRSGAKAVKKSLSLLLALMLLCGGLYTAAFAEETTAESTPEPTAVPEATPEPTATPAPAPVVSATSLRIDDANIYDGMDKAYRDGYLPQVADGTVTLVLPLVADGDIKGSQITVTPALGDALSSPIQYKNYQKTFTLEKHTVNREKSGGTQPEESMEAYLVCFAFPLKSERRNGTYAVSLGIQAQGASGNMIQQTYTCYFTVTDGRSTEAAEVITPQISTGMTVTEEAPESQPRILVSKYSIDPSPVSAGESFTATVTLRNTSETMAVQNMVVTVSCDAAGLVLQNDSSTIYIDKLGAGETTDIELCYSSDLETPPQRYNINLSMSYDNSDAMSLASAGTLTVEVAQIPKVELGPFNLEPELNAGETIQLSFQVMNLGRSPIYNARVELSAPGLYPVGTGFIGNMEAGTAAATKLDVFVGMKEDEAERYGSTSGTVTLCYEDADGHEYTQEADISTTIKALVIEAPAADAEEEAPTGQWWIAVAIGAVVIALLVLLFQRKKAPRGRHIKP